MIKKLKNKYYLYDHAGSKKLGGPYTTKEQAEKREKQVNYFKNKGGKKKRGAK